MCCVIPPASVSTTAVLRIASSRVVLPWSTWPMIVTPDSTVTGPVGWTTSRGCFGRASARSRAWRPSWRGRAAPVSITTRRLRRPPVAPWRGRIGRLGLFGRSAIRVSVDPCQLEIDPHPLPQRAVEGAPGRCPLEASQARAGVDAPPGALRRRREHAVSGDEAPELGLRRLPAAARAGPDGNRHALAQLCAASFGLVAETTPRTLPNAYRAHA